ncbi:hypothetical protein EX30DRAFT_395281 [Ascodesmis nigricans]|uniref:Uncharacterized protein n=1 Tax=Ascodesmis nigricans TaxID=341454 RepID=A0A4S2MZ31_9PEZI|nr:hypothetical protein EX30DRAFT_395281 [Ascodesmis nigricans]
MTLNPLAKAFQPRLRIRQDVSVSPSNNGVKGNGEMASGHQKPLANVPTQSKQSISQKAEYEPHQQSRNAGLVTAPLQQQIPSFSPVIPTGRRNTNIWDPLSNRRYQTNGHRSPPGLLPQKENHGHSVGQGAIRENHWITSSKNNLLQLCTPHHHNQDIFFTSNPGATLSIHEHGRQLADTKNRDTNPSPPLDNSTPPTHPQSPPPHPHTLKLELWSLTRADGHIALTVAIPPESADAALKGFTWLPSSGGTILVGEGGGAGDLDGIDEDEDEDEDELLIELDNENDHRGEQDRNFRFEELESLNIDTVSQTANMSPTRSDSESKVCTPFTSTSESLTPPSGASSTPVPPRETPNLNYPIHPRRQPTLPRPSTSFPTGISRASWRPYNSAPKTPAKQPFTAPDLASSPSASLVWCSPSLQRHKHNLQQEQRGINSSSWRSQSNPILTSHSPSPLFPRFTNNSQSQQQDPLSWRRPTNPRPPFHRFHTHPPATSTIPTSPPNHNHHTHHRASTTTTSRHISGDGRRPRDPNNWNWNLKEAAMVDHDDAALRAVWARMRRGGGGFTTAVSGGGGCSSVEGGIGGFWGAWRLEVDIETEEEEDSDEEMDEWPRRVGRGVMSGNEAGRGNEAREKKEMSGEEGKEWRKRTEGDWELTTDWE